jgi:hypothetical protein
MKIQKDSYWYVDESDGEPRMAALCEKCAHEKKLGTKWDGSQGYGDYDLSCKACGETIYLREINAE